MTISPVRPDALVVKGIHLNVLAMLISTFAFGWCAGEGRWAVGSINVFALLYNATLFLRNARTAK